ncbi:MAG: anthranilate synthase component I family protein [Chitinispirillia bacterium]|nr:anthranilate synthase component I family protein [Chitinispirillia bacterium]
MNTIKPNLEETKNISDKYNIIPISSEIYSDEITPITLLKKLKKVSKHCFILESVDDAKKWGRYTFLGFDPKMEITCVDGVTSIKTGDAVNTTNENPNVIIKKILNDHKAAKFDYLPPFTGGLVGYFSYDYGKYCEPKLRLDNISEDDEREDNNPANFNSQFNDVDLMLFDKIIAFDNLKQKIIIIVNISTKDIKDKKDEYDRAVSEIELIKKLIKDGECADIPSAKLKSPFNQLFSKDEFCAIVNQAKKLIDDGEISQVVLSNRFHADFEGSIFDTYRALRTINPSPYMFYFCGSDLELAGASPETMVKLQDRKLSTFPIGGTRPKGNSDEEDDALEAGLLKDKKELSEHEMLVDLGKEDLGKISKSGSVKVEKYMEILRFSHVMHICSTITGQILDDKDGLDAINAVLPAGTLSGAPKIRAMEIINELEKCKRGIYGGAIGYLDFTGNMDTCIAIRFAYRKDNKVFVRSGAGVVADSNPESEYQECVNKSMAVIRALEESSGI